MIRRHRFDALSLAFGLAFLAVAVLFGVDALDASLAHMRWIAAGGLLLLGVGMLVGTRGRGPDEHEDG